MREYHQCVEILRDLGLKKVKVLSNNPEKIQAMRDGGLEIVERVPIPDDLVPADAHVEIAAKKAAGYYTPDAIALDANPRLGDLRRSINSGEIVLFETTGAVEARDGVVAAETESERREGKLTLDSRRQRTPHGDCLTSATSI